MSRTDHPCYGDHNFLKSTRKCQWCGKHDPSHQIAMADIRERVGTINAKEREESETLMNKRADSKKKEMDVSNWSSKKLVAALRLTAGELVKRRILAPTTRVETFSAEMFDIEITPRRLHNFDFHNKCVKCGMYEDYSTVHNIECVS